MDNVVIISMIHLLNMYSFLQTMINVTLQLVAGLGRKYLQWGAEGSWDEKVRKDNDNVSPTEGIKKWEEKIPFGTKSNAL